MKRIRNTLLKTILSALFSVILFFQGTITAFAINTRFDVPSIEAEWTPDNSLYKSPNLNIQVCKWSYGLVANVLNTSNIDTLLAELHANISTAGYKRSVLSMYMEGAGLSAENAAAITNAGWTEIYMYYENYFVAGGAPTGAMTPSVVKATNENAIALLVGAGITENIAMFEVSDVQMAWANIILYEPEFKFLKSKSLYSYKFIPDLDVFVPIEETYFGAYGANFLELFDLQKAEADVNGIYVTLTQNLPETLVVSADEVTSLRENPPATPPTVVLPEEPPKEENETEPSGESDETNPSGESDEIKTSQKNDEAKTSDEAKEAEPSKKTMKLIHPGMRMMCCLYLIQKRLWSGSLQVD